MSKPQVFDQSLFLFLLDESVVSLAKGIFSFPGRLKKPLFPDVIGLDFFHVLKKQKNSTYRVKKCIFPFMEDFFAFNILTTSIIHVPAQKLHK